VESYINNNNKIIIAALLGLGWADQARPGARSRRELCLKASCLLPRRMSFMFAI